MGVVSPSSRINSFPRRLSRAVNYMTEDLGLEIVMGGNALNAQEYNAGTPEERAADIHNFFMDNSIKGIICSTGGYNSNVLLNLLDYSLVEQNPKVFCGFSDIAALTNSISHMTGLVTFSGPTALPSFGSFGGANEFTKEYFLKAVFKTEPIGMITTPEKYSDESLFWDRDDNRAPNYKPAATYSALNKAGVVDGDAWGGNLNTLCILIGTKYMPNLNGKVLFLEDGDTNIAIIERNLRYLEQVGVFSSIKALIFGRLSVGDVQKDFIYSVLKEISEKYNIPTIIDLDIGHTVPIITIPLGVNVLVNTDKPSVEITESGVV